MRNCITFFVFAILFTQFSAIGQEGPTNVTSTPPPATSITGSGTAHYLPVFTGSTTVGNSKVFQTVSGNVGIGTTSPKAKLDVSGAVNAGTSFNLGGVRFAFGSNSLFNTFFGFAGNSAMTGNANEASGYQALQFNTTGSNNTANGMWALHLNTTGHENTASGQGALASNTTGQQNTGFGSCALCSSTTSSASTAVGSNALEFSTGEFTCCNTAIGAQALMLNTAGWDNTATGFSALAYNTTGTFNTGFGDASLLFNKTGSFNTAIGYNAGPDQNSTDLSYATAIGAGAFVSESNAIVLGGTGAAAVKVGIGTATPSNVFTIAQGAGLAIGDGWTTYSSLRWKTNIHTLYGALVKVQQLRGVSYDLKTDGSHEIGVIAEEIGRVLPEVVTWDKTGNEAQGVEYGRITALLIEATKEQQAQIRQQQAQIKALQEQITELASQVNAQPSLARNTGTN